MTKKKNINLIYLGGFSYPRGMAGTKRIQHAIDALKNNPDVSSRVMVMRQSSRLNTLAGTYQGTPFETVMGDLVGASVIAFLPVQIIRAVKLLKQAWMADCKNIIYNYGPLDMENIFPLYYARHLGYRIVFDIVEDYSLARNISGSLTHKIKIGLIDRLDATMRNLASGIIVISSHLEKKYQAFVKGRNSLHFRPISIDMNCFPKRPRQVKPNTELFYAGSFGRKDGLSVLLDAFDKLAAKRKNVRLLLSGRGDREAMLAFNLRRQSSPYKERIEYVGYLDDEAYYAALNSADIPCMTRVDLAYAHAGFPFKLGEFLSSGNPVVVSRVSDVDRFLADRQSAMLVKPGDVVELCQAAEYLIDNPETATMIGQHGREVANALFNCKAQGEALLAYFNGL